MDPGHRSTCRSPPAGTPAGCAGADTRPPGRRRSPACSTPICRDWGRYGAVLLPHGAAGRVLTRLGAERLEPAQEHLDHLLVQLVAEARLNHPIDQETVGHAVDH